MLSKILLANKSWSRIRGITTLRFHSSQPSLDLRIDKKKPVTDSKFQEGSVIQGFKVEEVASIEEMYLTAIRLTHLGTGSEYLHLHRDDSNNVFSIGFRTTPLNSMGLPHILEHTVLCGSERYPCRDPFFKMLRRSLATFMNAFTAPDFTMYPFSTQNPKDFRNLQSVYLDSVFRPNLKISDFQQEGWRFEHEDANEPKSSIIFKGVVFNEMKGVFIENQNTFAIKMLNSLLPSHTYGVISGGDPLVIPQMTHKDLVDFHAHHYHPSNARFYSYGNFPLEEHLKFVNEQYLASSGKIDSSVTAVPSERRWKEPRKEHIYGRTVEMISDLERQNTMAIGHVCSDITDNKANFDLYVLSQLLLKGPNAAFYKSLVQSGIGTAFSPVTGFDSQCKDTLFLVGLQGMRTEDFPRMEQAYSGTIQKVMQDGFEKDHVAAVLHGIELHVKHQTSNFGLNLLFNLSPLWNHDGDLVQSLRINAALATLKSELSANPRYLQEQVEKYFWKNTHKLTLTMSPDEKLDSKLVAAEKQLLRQKLDKLSASEKGKIFESGQMLLREQQKKDDSGVLPTLKIEDLKKDVDRYDLQDQKVLGVSVQVAVQPTNEVCYFRSILNTQKLSPESKNLLPIFTQVAAKMGTENYDYLAFDRLIQLKTGGLTFANHVAEQKSDVQTYEEGILMESYCLEQNSKEMWQFWEELFNRIKLSDLKRFETLVKMHAIDLTNGIADSGHYYAMNSAASFVSTVRKLKESFSGLEYISRMKRVAQLKDMSPVLDEVKNIADQVLNKSCFRSAINVSPDHKETALRHLESFYSAIQGVPSDPIILTTGDSLNETETGIHHVMPYSVNYASKAILTVPYTDPDYSVLSVLAKLATNVYLHTEVREKGGAYGGGARLSSDGVFCFYSYRDPNSTRTLDLFDGTYEFLKKHPLPESDIFEAKLAIFQEIDSPVPPSNRGMVKFLNGVTYDDIQKRRERVKAVTKEDILRVAEKYLKPGVKGVNVGRSLIGPANADLAKRESENWTMSDGDDVCQARANE